MKIKPNELKALRQKGFFNDAQGTITANNIGMPAGILTQLSSQIVENVLAYRTGDEVLKTREKLVDWEDTEYVLPFAEMTGKTTPYGDYAQPKATGANVNYNKYGHYRFTTKYLYGELEASQYSKAKINYPQMVLNAGTEAIAVEMNRVAFNGYIENTSGSWLCYGLLNEPSLSNYVASAKTFATMTWQEVMAFFSTAVKALVTQTGNNINGQSNIRVPISASSYADLESKYTDLGVPVLETIQKRYPNMTFIPAIELDEAETGDNVIYFIGESQVGGLADTTKFGYSEISKMGNVIQGDYSYSQAMSAGTVGAIVYKPFMIIRYSGV